MAHTLSMRADRCSTEAGSDEPLGLDAPSEVFRSAGLLGQGDEEALTELLLLRDSESDIAPTTPGASNTT